MGTTDGETSATCVNVASVRHVIHSEKVVFPQNALNQSDLRQEINCTSTPFHCRSVQQTIYPLPLTRETIGSCLQDITPQRLTMMSTCSLVFTFQSALPPGHPFYVHIQEKYNALHPQIPVISSEINSLRFPTPKCGLSFQQK